MVPPIRERASALRRLQDSILEHQAEGEGIMDRDKQIELLMDVQDSCGEGAYVLGYTVYDRDGNYVATLTEEEFSEGRIR
jgi:hypothetical protein